MPPPVPLQNALPTFPRSTIAPESLLLNRRQNLAAGIAAFISIVLRKSAGADRNIVDELINQFTGGGTPDTAKIALDLPDTTDNGNSVPITVSVESSMTEDSYVTAVLVLADGNHRPEVATFYLSPESGAALVSTRIRLVKPNSGQQNVIAVARMNDGSCFIAKKPVTITDTGCR
jgi:sulfur-oxidizing protein SoxY